jgi:hypothetical protein
MNKKLTNDTQKALIHCTVKHNCNDCPLFAYGDTKLTCMTVLLERIRDELLIPKLQEDK